MSCRVGRHVPLRYCILEEALGRTLVADVRRRIRQDGSKRARRVIGGDGAAQGLTVRLGLSELYTEHPRQLVGFLAAKRIALRSVLLGDAAFTLRREEKCVASRDNQIKLCPATYVLTS